MSMTGEVLALALTLGVHVLGALALISVLVRDSGGSMRDWWPRDDGGEPPRDDPRPPGPQPGDGALPLPDAAPSTVRLREPSRLGDAYPRPPRRPDHPAPVREPEREPADRR